MPPSAVSNPNRYLTRTHRAPLGPLKSEGALEYSLAPRIPDPVTKIITLVLASIPPHQSTLSRLGRPSNSTTPSINSLTLSIQTNHNTQKQKCLLKYPNPNNSNSSKSSTSSESKAETSAAALSFASSPNSSQIVSVDALRKYLEEKIFPALEKKPFAVLYVHTGVQRCENFPGISAVRSIYDAIPINVKRNLEAVYFLHPGLQARLFLATFGRFLFTGGVYGKLKYVSRLDYLWEHVRRSEIEVPEFVYDHDEDLEDRPMMDYGLESDHPRVYDAPAVDSPVSMYSMRCIS